jgi:predicted RNA polymerase sigma factor
MEGVLRVIYLIFTEGYANPERGGSSEALCNEPFDWRGSYATCCLTARSSVSWR